MRKIEDYIENEGTRFERKKGVKIDDSDWEELLTKGIMDSSQKSEADDWVTAIRDSSIWDKYNRLMFSSKLDRLRSQDLEEFYGNGIVD